MALEQEDSDAIAFARRRLKQRLIGDARLLDRQLIGAGGFLNHRVDVELLDSCATALEIMLRQIRADVILTAEVSGIVPAALVARRLNVDMIYARKDLPRTLVGTVHTAQAASYTFNREVSLHLQSDVISPGTRVTIIDDFLSTGSSIQALVRLCALAGANPIAVGVIVNKDFLGGRAALAAAGLPVFSIATIVELSDAGVVFRSEGNQ